MLDRMSLRTTPRSVSTFGPFVPSPGYGPAVSSGISWQLPTAAAVVAVVAAVVVVVGRRSLRRRPGSVTPASAPGHHDRGTDAAEQAEQLAAGPRRRPGITHGSLLGPWLAVVGECRGSGAELCREQVNVGQDVRPRLDVAADPRVVLVAGSEPEARRVVLLDQSAFPLGDEHGAEPDSATQPGLVVGRARDRVGIGPQVEDGRDVGVGGEADLRHGPVRRPVTTSRRTSSE